MSLDMFMLIYGFAVSIYSLSFKKIESIIAIT